MKFTSSEISVTYERIFIYVIQFLCKRQTSAIIYSIIETAKENNLKPFEYLKYILETMPYIAMEQYSELLPWSKELPDFCRLQRVASRLMRTFFSPMFFPREDVSLQLNHAVLLVHYFLCIKDKLHVHITNGAPL